MGETAVLCGECEFKIKISKGWSKIYVKFGSYTTGSFFRRIHVLEFNVLSDKGD